MLKAIPNSWHSSDYEVKANGEWIADLETSSWREKGEILVEGHTNELSREGLMSGSFTMESNGDLFAEANKISAWKNTFNVRFSDDEFVLKKRSSLRSEMNLYHNNMRVGSIRREGLLSRTALIDLPDPLPLAAKLFIFWLTLIIWRREGAAAGGGGG